MRRILIALVSVSLLAGLSAPAQAKNPSGTRDADKSRSRDISGAVCGAIWGKTGNISLVAGKWVSKRNSQFISFKQLSSNDAKAAKKTKDKKKKQALTKSAKANAKKAKTYQSKCNTVNALKVNLSGKSGVAQGNTSSSAFRALLKSGSPEIRTLVGAGMNVFAVDAQGRFESMFPNLAEIIATKKKQCINCGFTMPTVTGMISGPSNKIYLVFNQKFNFNDMTDNMWNSPDSCMLAVVTPSSELLQCVDKELQGMMNWRSANQGNPSVQFDASGAAYYKGQFSRGEQNGSTDNSYTALRRNSNGVIKDIVQGQNLNIEDFVVLANGDVIAQGSTMLNNGQSNSWVRLFPADGVSDIIDLSSGSWGGFMRRLPDGNVYFGGNCSNNLNRFLTQSRQIDGSYTFSRQMNNCGTLYMGDLDFGTSDTRDDYIFTLSGESATQLWPQNDAINPTAVSRTLGMTNPSMIEGAGSFLVASGSDKVYSETNGALISNTYKTSILNPFDGSVVEVVGARGIEVYTLAYAGNGNLILNGQNRRGATVTGILSVQPGSLGSFNITQTDSGRVDDVQLFGQSN
jgi:hypothetical protein